MYKKMKERSKNILSAVGVIILTAVLFGGVVYLWMLIKEKTVKPKNVQNTQLSLESDNEKQDTVLASLDINTDYGESIYVVRDGYKILLNKKTDKKDFFFESSEIEDFVSEYFSFPGEGEIILTNNKDGDVFVMLYGNSGGIVPYINRIVYKINFEEQNLQKIYEAVYSPGNLKEGIPGESLVFTFESSALLKDDIVFNCESVDFNSNSEISLNRCEAYKIKGYTERIIAAEEYGPLYLQSKQSKNYIYHDSEGKEMSEALIKFTEDDIYLKLQIDGVYRVFKNGSPMNKFII